MDTFDSEDWVFDLEMTAEHTGPDVPVPGHYPMDETASVHINPPQAGAITGTQLRRRLITPEALAETAQEVAKPSLLQRLLQHLPLGLLRRR